MDKKFSVLGIGNAMVDIIIEADDAFLTMHGIQKGIMQLIDIKRANQLYNKFGTQPEVSGGSGANTIVGLASLDVPTCYIGKVKNDPLGKKFYDDLKSFGVDYTTAFAKQSSSSETGRCVIFVTPDGERSLNTYLGVSENLNVDDIESSKIAQSDWMYLEGYRFDGAKSEQAFSKAIITARKNLCKIALTLSDPFCVERNLISFKEMVSNDIDLLFCNEVELKLLYQTDDLDTAIKKGSKDVELLACTVAEKGAILAQYGNIVTVPAKEIRVLDTTGAGDLFAAGFFYGLIHKKSIEQCGEMGNLAASEIISHFGARPEIELNVLFKNHGF